MTTPDGYILRFFRIPSRRLVTCTCSRQRTHSAGSCGIGSCENTSNTVFGEDADSSCNCSGSNSRNENNSSSYSSHRSSPMVFMQHALMDSSAGWLLLGPKRSLALQLADAGFDVWLGNSRGNRYSRNHTQLSPDEPGAGTKFWAYSWDDMAQFDLPSSINYSMQVSRQSSCVYIGYSQVTSKTFKLIACALYLAPPSSACLKGTQQSRLPAVPWSCLEITRTGSLSLLLLLYCVLTVCVM